MKDIEKYKYRTLSTLANHTGSINAIGMAELYETIFHRDWSNRINDTRKLRTVITVMRNEGVPICSVSAKNGGGYYLAAAGSELTGYLDRAEHRALKVLARNARIKRIALPEYLGQMKLNLEGEE